MLNVGSNFEITINQLAYKIAKYIGYEGEIPWDHSKPDGTKRKKLDCSKLDQLGWKAKINLDKGIDLTIKDFYKNIKSEKKRITF